MFSILKEFLQFLMQEKKWWIIPIVVVLMLMGVLLVLGKSTGLGALVYPFI